jgi:6-phosphogluconolactonase (cycloisomerase 2 family)
MAACWGDGHVLLYELDRDGGITRRFQAAPSVDPHHRHSPNEPRQSRAHASLMLADGRIMTTDLGHDTLRIWTYAPGQGLTPDHEVVLPLGSGPRHLVQHASGSVFVVAEHSIEVFVVDAAENGTFTLLGARPAASGGAVPGDSAAEICLGPGGNYAYVGIRGSNRIGILSASPDGKDLTPQADVDSGGDWPRHQLVLGRWLHVAHERSGDVVTFELDSATGLPGPVLQVLKTPSPTALVPCSSGAA